MQLLGQFLDSIDDITVYFVEAASLRLVGIICIYIAIIGLTLMLLGARGLIATLLLSGLPVSVRALAYKPSKN